ncbi:hypothetical protein CEXT_317811 [Caerostris extrusa]|uniref:Uncharacterized protein n=1 Tax=Caerostris extrusa TaxID=172846 RepID=A0AAV4V1W2_CAEEX|nr:hypothetical protein CEXT_317811 [Caerostris extrusa]
MMIRNGNTFHPESVAVTFTKRYIRNFGHSYGKSIEGAGESVRAWIRREKIEECGNQEALQTISFAEN